MSDEQSTTVQEQELGDGGLSALRKERENRKAIERELRAANERIAAFERRDLVHEVASAKGLDTRFADRLKGSTREEIEADADALVEMLKPAEPTRTLPPGNRTERLRGGADPSASVEPSASQMADRILE